MTPKTLLCYRLRMWATKYMQKLCLRRERVCVCVFVGTSLYTPRPCRSFSSPPPHPHPPVSEQIHSLSAARMAASLKASGGRPSPRVAPSSVQSATTTFQFFPTPSAAGAPVAGDTTTPASSFFRPPQCQSKAATAAARDAILQVPSAPSLPPPHPYVDVAVGARQQNAPTERRPSQPTSTSSSPPAVCHDVPLGEFHGPQEMIPIRARGPPPEKRSRSPPSGGGLAASPAEQRAPLVGVRAAASTAVAADGPAATGFAALPTAEVSRTQTMSESAVQPAAAPKRGSVSTPPGVAAGLRGTLSTTRTAASSLPSSAVGGTRSGVPSTSASAAAKQQPRPFANAGDASRHRTSNSSAAGPAARCHSSGSLATTAASASHGAFAMSRGSASCSSHRGGADHEPHGRRVEVDRIRRELYKWNEQLRQEAEARQQAHHGSMDGV